MTQVLVVPVRPDVVRSFCFDYDDPPLSLLFLVGFIWRLLKNTQRNGRHSFPSCGRDPYMVLLCYCPYMVLWYFWSIWSVILDTDVGWLMLRLNPTSRLHPIKIIQSLTTCTEVKSPHCALICARVDNAWCVWQTMAPLPPASEAFCLAYTKS